MKRILSTLTLLLCFAFTAVNAQDNYNATEMGAIVKYYETAKWGQQSPFNDQIYTESGGSTHGAAGCVPTAYAIIMRYWGFPTEGTSSDLRHCQTNESITDRTYDWSKMPLTNGNGWTNEQRNEVSKLFAHVLHAVFPASIGSSYTDANEGGSTSYLETHFGYTNISSSQQWQHTKDAWEAKMKESLDNGCPIPYASKNTGTGDARHMFVIDGYTTEGYYHINFGWNGYANGWHKLDEIKPADSNGNLTGDNYSWVGDATSTSAHKAFFNLAPKTEKFTVTATAEPSNMGTVSINGGTAGTTVTADLMQGFTATLTATANSGYTFSHWSKNGSQVGAEKTLKVTVAAENNDYVANFLTVGNNRVNVSVTYNSSYGTVTYNGNAVQGTGITPYQNSEVTLVATPLDGYVFNGWTVTNGTNSTNYAGNELTFIATENMSVEARFSTAEIDYSVTASTLTKSGNEQGTSGYCSTYTFNGGVAFTLTTTIDDVEAYALTTSNQYIDFYATAHTKNVSAAYPTNIKYTLSAPEGYLIKKYSFDLKSSGTYSINVNYGNNNNVTIDNSGYKTISETNIGKQSVSFILSTDYNRGRAKAYVDNFSITLEKISGEGGGSTPTPDPTTTYNITAEASPQNAGKVAINGGTQSTVANIDATSGSTVSLQAYPNSGYEFAGWYNGTTKVSSDNPYSITATAAISYIASFQEVQQGGSSSTDLGGKYFRIKVNNTSNYMNIANTSNNTGSTSGVTVVAKNESSDTQVFFFEQSGDGYKLKANSGNYIKCHAWNANANTTSANDATVLTFETTGNELGYLIKWDNTNMNEGVERDDYFKAENGYVYCDAASTKATTWVLEEVVYYTVTATAGNGGSVSPETSTVKQGNTVTLTATANAGYRFVNWTKGETVVSTDATYSFTATEITSLVANFEQIVVNATLTDAQSNTYNVQLSGFTNGVTKETVATKLTEKYPYITLGTVENVITLNGSNGAYTYTNTVELPFKVSNATYIWHNIYYPANSNDNPNYIAALNEDEVVDMAASKDYAYGDNPTYNTKDGGNSICWAIYNVNNSFEFIFKSRVTGKYIKVESVSSSTTENVKFVENAEDATAFTLLAKETVDLTGVNPAVTGDCNFALVANVKDATGYLCATSSDKDYVTHFDRYNHRGAWVKIVEAPDYFSKIMDMGTMLGLRFGAGDGKCVIAGTNIEEVNNAMQNSGSITLNNLNKYAARMEVAMATENPTWFDVRTSAENGAAYITLENDDPELTSKRVPGGYELTVKAAPATGYHFTGWTMNGTAIEGATDELRFTVTEATTIVASFAINTYNVNVTAGENGSVTVTHDVNGEPVDINGETVDFATVIKIEATPNDGYKFIGWYNGEELQHGINPHEFAINNDINYTARFEEEEAGSTTNKYVIKINATLTDGGTAVNNATGNVKAIIDGIGQDWPTSAEVVENARVELVAISDHNQSGYLFEGWYKNGERVSTALRYKVAVTETVTYEARFAKGRVIKLATNNKSLCLPNMPTYTDGSEVAGTTTALRAVVRDGEELLISIDDKVIENFTGEGYRVANWTDEDGNEVAGKNVYSFTITVNGDNTYKVNLEKDTYTLTVSTEATMGTVHIGDGIETSVTVNNGETATITATPNSGYKFVNWTLNGEVVSTENSYNVPAITDNVLYVAVFAEANALDAGYYRIAYDFEVPVAAKSAATRAAGDNYTYAVNYGTGTSENVSSSRAQEWVYTNNTNEPTLTLSATFGDTPVYAINMGTSATANPKLYTHNLNSNTETPVKYTLAVSEDYIITNYSFEYYVYHDNYGFTINGTSPATKTWLEFSSGDVNAQTAEFTISSTNRSSYMIVKNFTVTIQPVGGETPEPETETVRYYVQSGAVNATNNAMPMTTDGEGVSSIFYYDGGKLISYQKGTYVNENGGIRGLQAVGVYEGDKTNIKVVGTNDEDENICTIAAPSYMHAKESNGIYYVDNCGATATCDNDDHNFILEEVTSLPVTITSAGYATWYAPVAVELPTGVTAYTITIDGDYAITGDGFKTVPANTGVILAGAQGTYDLAITTTTDEVESILEGTVAAAILPNESAYVLSNDKGNKELGFYLANNGQASYSHKAYLPKSALTPAMQMSTGFRLMLPGTTAVEKVESRNEKEEIYDLTGRKLEGISGAGIYIINGKKVLIK